MSFDKKNRLRFIGISKNFPLDHFLLTVNSCTNITDRQLMECCKKFNCEFKMPNVAEAFLIIYEATKPSQIDCETLLLNIGSLAVMNYDIKMWNGYILSDTLDDEVNVTANTIREKFSTKLKKNNLEVLLDVSMINGLLSFAICEYVKKYKKFTSHVYIAYNLEMRNYVFTTIGSKQKLLLELFVKSCGFKEYKPLNLEGKNVVKLYNRIASSSKAVSKVVPPFIPVIKNEKIIFDYTLEAERRRYAREIFPGTSDMYTLSVTSNCEWRGGNTLNGRMNGKRAITKLTFKSLRKNYTIEDFFRKIVIDNAVKFPLPKYMTNVSFVTANSLILTEQTQSNSQLFHDNENNSESDNSETENRGDFNNSVNDVQELFDRNFDNEDYANRNNEISEHDHEFNGDNYDSSESYGFNVQNLEKDMSNKCDTDEQSVDEEFTYANISEEVETVQS